ncbi:hypothetical protein AVEN_236913-1 [Araneus ventricosus]|uniref:Histone-lysine N-methyltransferase SETMAR n=1 Tax=Araneus ventricosus TaxID=182803 RepID=A0A4Y2DTC9_ARAVE|nr:hypothetical protein AVEN_236913-1 [Araneus ventricosus]
MRIESNDVLAKSIFSSQSLTGRMVRAPASQALGREFYPGLCSYSVFAIICNASLLQVRPMVTLRLALTCCKLVSHLHTCRDKFAESLQICSASLLQTKIAIWGGILSQGIVLLHDNARPHSAGVTQNLIQTYYTYSSSITRRTAPASHLQTTTCS